MGNINPGPSSTSTANPQAVLEAGQLNPNTNPVGGTAGSLITTSFYFGNQTITTVPQASLPVTGINAPYQLSATSTSTGTVVIQWQGTNDALTAAGIGTAWTIIGQSQITGNPQIYNSAAISGGTASISVNVPYLALRANVTALATGTVSASILQGQSSLVTSQSSIGAVQNSTNPALVGVPITSGRYVLSKSAIPLITASTGTTSGTTGTIATLTLGTALTTGLTGPAWVLLPAGAYTSGSAQGVYYCNFSSSTVANLYSIILQPYQNPYIPSTAQLAAGTLPASAGGAYSGLVAATLMTVKLLGGSMGPNGSLFFRCICSMPNNANVHFPGWQLAGQNLINSQMTSTAAGGIDRSVHNRGVQNSQVCHSVVSVSGTGYIDGQNYANPPQYYSIDTSVNQDIVLYGYTGVATDNFVMEAYVLEIEYGA